MYHNKKIKTYCRIKNKKITPLLNNIFMDRDFEKTYEKQKCDLFMPSNDDELNMLKFPKNTIVSTIDNINHINKKNLLWKNLVEQYGRHKAGLIIPPTYNILQKNELRMFAEDYYKNKGSFILKNEQESARGILVSNKFQDMLNHILRKKRQGYPVKVVQRIIKSHLINGRVFKIRMFLLIKCDRETGIKHYYLHNLGGIFYAPEQYDEKNLNNDNIIANGYWYNNITHSDYIGFINDKPKNLKEIYKHLEKDGINPKKMMERVIYLLILIFKSINNKIYRKNVRNEQFCILGFDIMIDENKRPWIIEFNKGPSMKDYHDANVFYSKKKVWNDIYKLIENDNNNDFKEIYRSI